MRARTVLMLVLALGLAAGTAGLTRNLLSDRAQSPVIADIGPQLPAQRPISDIEVLVATEDLPAGTFLTPDLVEWRNWPEDAVDERFLIRRLDETGTPIPEESADTAELFGEDDADISDTRALIGTVSRVPLTAGLPIHGAHIVSPGDRGFLAAVLAPGMRAVSVPVTSTSGISGFVFPGDRVDLLLSVRLQGEGADGDATTRYAGLTAVTGVRVLAMDQRTETVDGEIRLAETATLEIEPKDSEKIALSLGMGDLSLALHSLVDTDSLEDQIDRWNKFPYTDPHNREAAYPHSPTLSETQQPRLAVGPAFGSQRTAFQTASAAAPSHHVAPSALDEPLRTVPLPYGGALSTQELESRIPSLNESYSTEGDVQDASFFLPPFGNRRNYTMDWELFTIAGHTIPELGLMAYGLGGRQNSKPVTVFRGDSAAIPDDDDDDDDDDDAGDE